LLVAPSILASDFLNLSEEIKLINLAKPDFLHVDVMDGCFVPPISFGQEIVGKIASVAEVPLDIHLMIDQPETKIESFLKYSPEILTFHLEATKHAHRICQEIKKSGTKVGIAINPGTSVQSLDALLPYIDLILVMTVNPGWGGQKFISSMTEKIKWIRSHGKGTEHIQIEVDGGINQDTAKICSDAGANIVVAGTYVFSGDYKSKINLLKGV